MTTVQLDPNGTVSSGRISLVGGATAHAVTSDVSNATYFDINAVAAAPGYAVLDLTGYTLGTNEIVASARIVAVCSGFTTPPNYTFSLALRDGLGTVYAGSVISRTNVGGGGLSFETIAGPSLAQALSQAQLTGLAAYAVITTSSGSPIMRVTQVWVEVVVAVPPTVVVNGPTGTIGSATPTITSTYTTGSDGDAQSKIRFKVFSAAQYGAGGFDPETSTPTYDSGDLSTSATSHTVATPLTNSTTWRAYVKAAHTINGQLGWSPWAYSGFATSYATSDVQTVTVTPDNVNGKNTIVVARNTGSTAWLSIDVERSDDGGTTWLPVRGATRKGATNTFMTAWAANSATVVDYEAGNGVTTRYRARAINAAVGIDVVGAWTLSAAPSSWSSTDVWLKAPLQPSLNRVVQFEAKAPELTFGITQGVHHPAGRADAVVVSDVRQLGTSQLVLETYTYTEGTALKALLDATLLLLQMPAGMRRVGSIYLAAGDVAELTKSVADEWQVWPMPVYVIAQPADTTP